MSGEMHNRRNRIPVLRYFSYVNATYAIQDPRLDLCTRTLLCVKYYGSDVIQSGIGFVLCSSIFFVKELLCCKRRHNNEYEMNISHMYIVCKTLITYKRFFSCSGKINEHEYSFWGQKTR